MCKKRLQSRKPSTQSGGRVQRCGHGADANDEPAWPPEAERDEAVAKVQPLIPAGLARHSTAETRRHGVAQEGSADGTEHQQPLSAVREAAGTDRHDAESLHRPLYSPGPWPSGASYIRLSAPLWPRLGPRAGASLVTMTSCVRCHQKS